MYETAETLWSFLLCFSIYDRSTRLAPKPINEYIPMWNGPSFEPALLEVEVLVLLPRGGIDGGAPGADVITVDPVPLAAAWVVVATVLVTAVELPCAVATACPLQYLYENKFVGTTVLSKQLTVPSTWHLLANLRMLD